MGVGGNQIWRPLSFPPAALEKKRRPSSRLCQRNTEGALLNHHRQGDAIRESPYLIVPGGMKRCGQGQGEGGRRWAAGPTATLESGFILSAFLLVYVCGCGVQQASEQRKRTQGIRYKSLHLNVALLGSKTFKRQSLHKIAESVFMTIFSFSTVQLYAISQMLDPYKISVGHALSQN